MSFIDVYIGDLDDPTFNWEDGDWNGNIPRAISKMFPESRGFAKMILGQIDSGNLDGKQIDFAGWVARVTPGEILILVDIFYKPKNEVKGEVQAIRQLVQKLDSNKKYALVACET